MGSALSMILIIVSFLLGSALITIASSRWKSLIAYFLVLVYGIGSSIMAVCALTGNPLEVMISWSHLFGDIPIRMDALSAWFVLIINLTMLTGGLYGISYMKAYEKQPSNLSMHWILFVIFHLSMLSVCVIQNGFVFLIAWEMMSLSSLILIMFEHQKADTLKAGINYLVQMHIGVAFLTVAFVWIYFSEGSFDFHSGIKFFSSHRNVWLFLLLFLGFGIKAGFVPLHSWLPHAHPAAPSHISGIMSGVIVKLGIYGILRFALMLQNDLLLIGKSMLIISMITGVYGILNASVHRDFKKMLAYCTIENIGIIGAGIGLFLMGMGIGNRVLIVIGLSGALLHTLNHSLFKSLLFFSVGSVYQQTHTHDMEKLGGLIGKMPQTALCFLIGALAIGGLPPFNGFVSEFIIYSGYLEGIQTIGLAHSSIMILSMAGFAFIGGLSLLTFTKSFGVIFLGNPRSPQHTEPEEVSLVMRLPQYFIMVLMLFIGLFPAVYFSILIRIIHAVLPSEQLPDGSAFSSMIALIETVGYCSSVLLLSLIVVFAVRYFFTRTRTVAISSTWGCGYVAPNNKQQYTGKSFSKTAGKLLGFIVTEKKDYKELKTEEIFPESRRHSSNYIDFFEVNIFNTVINRMIHGLGYFQFIQNGKIQMYVLYGVFFIVLIFLGTISGLI